MVAYIEYAAGPVRTWYIGQKTELLQEDHEINRTLAIQADGNELEYILRKFTNIPMVVDKRVMTWYGDTAKFIVKHL